MLFRVRTLPLAAALAALVACRSPARHDPDQPPTTAAPGKPRFSLPELRHKLHTTIFMTTDQTPPPDPPPDMFVTVHYPAPLGSHVAYATPVRAAGARLPAIVWIHGGFDWGIGGLFWQRAPRYNDQTAAAFRRPDMVLMLPALRGSSGNPGRAECFLGEVDDIIAAADYLARRPDVDPKRIYLGGHSTGGTLALLTAESTDRFRGVFPFGAVADPRQYGEASCVPRDAAPAEAEARSGIAHISEIVTPTVMIEGQNGNAAVFPMLAPQIGRAPVRFVVIPGIDHFGGIAAGTEVVADAIVADTGPTPHFDITPEKITARLKAAPTKQ